MKAAKEDGDAASGHRVSLMALKCLNNAIWDQPAGQTAFVHLGGLDMLVALLKVMSHVTFYCIGTLLPQCHRGDTL